MPHHRSRPMPVALSRIVLRCGVAITTALWWTAPTSAQPGPVLQRARGLIAAGKPSEAVAPLDSLTKAQPELKPAWFLLGTALLGARQLDRAVPALQRAIDAPALRPAALFNLGLAHGLRGEMDSAFHRLLEARATGRIDMTQLGFDNDAGPIRASARYAELLPSAADYDAPFTERVTVLREWDGEMRGEQFGWIARDIGDVDGDGIHDVVTSAPTTTGNAGAVSVYSSGTGARLWIVRGAPGDQLGMGVEAAGDVDGDGVPDVIAGAPGGNHALLLAGRDGRVIRRVEARQRGEGFGRNVSDVGDVNADGFADVAISAPQNDDQGIDAGAVYIVSGRDGRDLRILRGSAAGQQFGSAGGGRTVKGTTVMVFGAPASGRNGRAFVFRGSAVSPALTLHADSTAAQFGGSFASVVGDVDGDQHLDFYVSDWMNVAKGPTTGRIYVYSGATGALLYSLTGEAAGHGFGIGVADAGDVDGDGADDLIIGAWQYGEAAAVGGKVYLYSGRSARLLGTLTGRVMGESLGFDATGVGDVNGDGTPDLLVTSAWSAKHGTRSGRMFIISGKDLLNTLPPSPPAGR